MGVCGCGLKFRGNGDAVENSIHGQYRLRVGAKQTRFHRDLKSANI